MIYFLYGNNSYRALHKIADVKSAFYKKRKKNIAITEIDGTRSSFGEALESISAGNLFAEQRLVILKQTLATYPQLLNIVMEKGKELAASRDVFVFWEYHIPNENKNKTLSVFKKIAEKIEETSQSSSEELDRWLQKEANARGVPLNAIQRRAMTEVQLFSGAEVSTEWALSQELEKMALGGDRDTPIHYKKIEPAQNRIFSFIDRVFGNQFSCGLVAFQQAKKEGIDAIDFSRMFLWKLKNIFLVKRGESKKLNPYVAQKTSIDAALFGEQEILDAFWEGIVTDSALKRDSKNIDEHIESYILSMKRQNYLD